VRIAAAWLIGSLAISMVSHAEEFIPKTTEVELKNPAIKIAVHGLQRMNKNAKDVDGEWVIDHRGSTTPPGWGARL
jgi:hypothetical protein